MEKDQSDEIVCPWCKDAKSNETILSNEGVLFCSRCKNYFVWERYTEVTYKTKKIKFVK